MRSDAQYNCKETSFERKKHPLSFWQCGVGRDLHSGMVGIFYLWTGVVVAESLRICKHSIDVYVNLHHVPRRYINESVDLIRCKRMR